MVESDHVKTLYDFMKLFISDDFIKIVMTETQRYAVKQNQLGFQSKVANSPLKASYAIMFMTEHLKLSNCRMNWEKKHI